MLADGCLLHLGRKDFQVKIRGYRVETSEVEGALLSLESVREAVVAAQADVNGVVGDRLLVAYLTAVNSENKPTAKELKEAMAARLPDYAIPAYFLWLESLPLTATGKIDRRTLPLPDTLLTSDLDLVAPRTATEEKLVQIWSEVLNLEAVGVENNFFELGGNSLHASRVLARISENFKSELSLKTIFAAPTIAQLAKECRDAIGRVSTLPPLVPTPIRETQIPLSLAQQRLWFVDRLESNKAIYNLVRGFRLTGNIDVGCLEGAVEAIIERHEILRTSFEVVDGLPVQAIVHSLPFSLEISDLQDLPATEHTAKVEEITREIQGWIFDLARPPLLKMVLIRLSDREHHLLITMHHIISDDWSIQVFLKELSLLYKAFRENSAMVASPSTPSTPSTPSSPLPPLPIQYADYTHWQHQYLAGEVVEEQLNYWRSQLADAPPLLELPTDFPRTNHANAGFQSDVVPLKIDNDTTEKLKALSQRSRTTLFVTLLTAWAVLLSRYSNQDDIVVGTASANRNPAITEGLIGFFVSTLALRIKLLDNPTFLTLLNSVQQTAIEAHAHADVPFDRLVEALSIERHLGHNPLFQVLFVLQNVTQEKLAFPDIETERLDFMEPTAGATFDLTLSLRETVESGLQGTLEYNVKLFEPETIARMAKYFQILLKAIVTEPECPVGFLPLLDREEKDLYIAPQPEISGISECCLHQWFETQVEKTPDAIAVRCEESQLTYRELNERANQLAHYLQKLGVQPDTLVGLCVERSLLTIVGILGILKAGGAYVPLDPANPQSRLDYIAQDSQIKVLITQSELSARISHCQEIVCLDTDWEKIQEQNSQNPISQVKPQNLAYVIYTSGSTGKPKGVLVTHANATRLFTATDSWYGFNEKDVWTLFHSYAFDFSVWEIWGALLYGGRLIVIPYWTSRDTAAFYQLLISEGVTVLNQTPSAFYQLIEIDNLTKGKLNLRFVIFGGEALEMSALKPWFDRHGDRQPQLVNMYGITETTVHVTYRPLSLADVEGNDSPIGVPIPDLQIYLLDRYKQQVPKGVRGEMYVGGGGVTRGYLNRSDLTAERFISNPFNHSTVGTNDAKLYKTGDLARYLPNGELVYLGRIDNQVKIRGFRIELGEIEAALSQHPQVKQGIVMVREERPGDKSLVAYAFVAQEEVSNAELRHYLQQKLPHYMVPSILVILDEPPLTPNGKVDRRALPAPERELSGINVELVAPRTETETKLLAIWVEILERQQIGINQNFFELGGHSLLATQLMFRIRKAFEIDMSLRALFDHPSISALARAIDQVLATGDYQSQALNLEAETVLARDIQPSTATVQTIGQIERIFLTGATGFLGSHLLYELLTTTPATIYCLVRADNLDAGWERLQEKLKTSGLWSEDFSSRIIPIIGDLGISSFGLSATQYNNLCQEIDVIYHVGVKVHHLLSYALLKNANVLGTEEVLRMASLAKIKPVHYVSTISVFSNSQSDRPILESATVNHPHLFGGYVQTKWVGEQLVWEAANRGLPVKVYRPSRIGGSSKTGVYNFDDLLSRFIKGCIRLKHFPTWEGFEENLIPVDYASKAILFLSQKEDSFGKAFNVINPESVPLKDIFNWVSSLGYDLEEIDYNHWRAELIEAPDNPLYPYLAKFPESLSGTKEKIEYDRSNVVEGLKGSSIELPEVNRDLLKTYLSYFEASGFLWN